MWVDITDYRLICRLLIFVKYMGVSISVDGVFHTVIILSLVDNLHYLPVNVQMAKPVVLRREGVLFATVCPYRKICTE
jgi:hypothetical protein